uniref:Ig-like domain-containing protein n=1 Tax=Sparus aurata TaxID=8175 RepID=A0A671UVL8_SPAAU
MFNLKFSLDLCDLPCPLFAGTGKWSRLVLLSVCFLSLRGHSRVPFSQPIVAMIGADIVLPCQMERAVDASGLTVEWSRPVLDPKFVHLRRDSEELVLEENPLYKGRTSLSTNRLKRSVSFPDIKISKVSNGVLLVCKSTGWYPEPEVFWLDGEGNLLPAEDRETVRGPDDLYTVSSRVTVEKRHSNSFTCRVQQNHINQTREAQIHSHPNNIYGFLFLVQSCSAVRISICLVVCILSISAVVFIVWKGRQNTISKSQLECTQFFQS